MANSQLSLSNIEKLVQISSVYGNVVVKGDVLVTFGKNVHKALGYSSQPESGLTDYIVKLTDKFGKKELINLDTGLEISLALLIHPSPTMALKILSEIRPNADSNTLFLLFTVAQIIANEIKLFESLQVDKAKQIESVGQAFQVTDAYKKIKIEDIPDDVIQKILDGYFRVFGTGEYGERLYFTQHQEVISMSADLHLAKICISAFLNSDERVVNNFMEIREYLSSFRKKG